MYKYSEEASWRMCLSGGKLFMNQTGESKSKWEHVLSAAGLSPEHKRVGKLGPVRVQLFYRSQCCTGRSRRGTEHWQQLWLVRGAVIPLSCGTILPASHCGPTLPEHSSC